MRRKSERKSKSSPEKKTPETTAPTRRSHRRRRQKSASSSPEPVAVVAEPTPPEDEENTEEIVTPSVTSEQSDVNKPSNSNSDEEQEEAPVWQVKTTENQTGEIQKLKICLQRPSSTPERVERSSPRRQRKHRSGDRNTSSVSQDDDSCGEDLLLRSGRKAAGGDHVKTRRSRSRFNKDEDIVDSSSEDKTLGATTIDPIEINVQIASSTDKPETPNEASTTTPTPENRTNSPPGQVSSTDVVDEQKAGEESNEEEVGTSDQIINEAKSHQSSPAKHDTGGGGDDVDDEPDNSQKDEKLNGPESTSEIESQVQENNIDVSKSETDEISTESTEIAESTETTESAEITKSTGITESTETTESAETTESTETTESKEIEEKEEIIEKEPEVVETKPQSPPGVEVEDESSTSTKISELPEETKQEVEEEQEEETSSKTSPENIVEKVENITNKETPESESSEEDEKSPAEPVKASPVSKEKKKIEMHTDIETPVVDPKRKKLKLREFITDTYKGVSLKRLSSDFIRDICPEIALVAIEDLRLEEDVEEAPKKPRKKIFEDKKIVVTSSKDSNSVPTTPTTPNPLLTNRKISIVGDETDIVLQRPPSPAENEPSPILYIKNLVRPFTLNQLRELLSRTGTIKDNGFWINKIKSECYVEYESQEQAEETRNALHGVHWPVANGRRLVVDFGTSEAMEKARTPADAVKPPTDVKPEKTPTEEATVTPKEEVPPVDWREERERERQRREQRGVREWDVGKQGQQDRSPSPATAKRRHASPSRTESPDRKVRKKEDVPAKLLDDLFRKTKATPCIYWLPLSAEMIAIKEEQRRKHMAEHERRLAELRRIERTRRAPGRRGGRYD